jgi:hypothetical protein
MLCRLEISTFSFIKLSANLYKSSSEYCNSTDISYAQYQEYINFEKEGQRHKVQINLEPLLKLQII